MEITWHWNFLETIAAVFLFVIAAIVVFKVVGFIYLWIMFRGR